MTKEETQIVRKYMSALGRRGGKARMTKMSAKARQTVARIAAETRWKRVRVARGSRQRSQGVHSTRGTGSKV